MCWKSSSDLKSLSAPLPDTDTGVDGGDNLIDRRERSLELKATPWDNKLYRSFVLTGEANLLPECPTGLYVEGDVPHDQTELENNHVILRTGQFHDYVVKISINLDTMDGDYIFSDDGPRIAVQVS